MADYTLPSPSKQVAFHQLLVDARVTILHGAVADALGTADPDVVAAELGQLAPSDARQLLAKAGLRDKHVFATPEVLRARPTTLGYYRLLLGVSKKAFYTTETGLRPFQTMEEKDRLTKVVGAELPALCQALNAAMAELLTQLAPSVTRLDIDQLPLLTLGAQLDGGWRNGIGRVATEVFLAIREIVEQHNVSETATALVVQNAAGRRVRVVLASDPDVAITEEFVGSDDQLNVAVEIKGGTDRSNAHNLLDNAIRHTPANGAVVVEAGCDADAAFITVRLPLRHAVSRFLVTGGAGFIGSHVVEQLVGADHEVVVLDRALHPAWLPPRSTTARTTSPRRRRGRQHWSVSTPCAIWRHGWARCAGLGRDRLRRRQRRRHGGRLVGARRQRVSWPVGAGQQHGRLRRRRLCLRRARCRPARASARLRTDRGRFEPPCPRCGSPLQPVRRCRRHLPECPRRRPCPAGVRGRSPTERLRAHVRDVARANVLALTAPEPAVDPFNVGSGVVHTVGDLATALAEHAGEPAPVVTGAWRHGDVRHIVASAEAARTSLGFHASVSFEEGVAELIDEGDEG